MYIIVFFAVVILFSLVLNAVEKIRMFKREEKSVWEDGDSVRIERHDLDEEQGEGRFMKRIS